MATPQIDADTERADLGQQSEEPRGGVSFQASSASLKDYITSQDINLARHAAALRPFRRGEFGTGPASPSEAHRLATNKLVEILRKPLLQASKRLKAVGIQALHTSTFAPLRAFNELKERGHRWVEATEKVWNFYFELFNLRQTTVAGHLLAADRIGLDCYQAIYTNLGAARSIPSPPPFSYMETGFAPSTFRRGVILTKLGRRANPFPLIKLPYHRLVNPWTLGAIPHEVSHNIQADLGLWQFLPREIFRRLRTAGIDMATSRTWARWHKEIYADLCGLLLSGPAFVTSLMDIVGNSPARTLAFNPKQVHPIPYLRVYVNLELLRRMGFAKEAQALGRTWNTLYPRFLARTIPPWIRKTFPRANRLVVDTICFRRFPQYGGKYLAEVVCYSRKHHAMVQEAARRLAAGIDPGIINERFFIGAARWALDHKLARPGVITRNFYQTLIRR